MNPYVNKVQRNVGGSLETVIDLSGDTVTADKLASGYTAHDASGATITGTAAVPLDPIMFDMKYGYIASGTWKYEDPTNTYTDIYEIVTGHTYLITLGGNVGSRFRAMTSTVDVRTSTSDVAGTQVINKNNPTPYDHTSFKSTIDGYLYVAKDNVGKAGVKSYVYDADESWA